MIIAKNHPQKQKKGHLNLFNHIVGKTNNFATTVTVAFLQFYADLSQNLLLKITCVIYPLQVLRI